MLAHFDCFSGISGDMIMGAFLDAGVPMDWLQESLSKLRITPFQIMKKTVRRGPMAGTQIGIQVEGEEEESNFENIVNILEKSGVSPEIRETAFQVFDKIATAESIIHGIAKEKVHLHEVGGMDTMIDVIGSLMCLEYLGIEKVSASPVSLGHGFTKCMHGRIPVPAPATLEILKGIPVRGLEISEELTTPTGAAIVSTVSDHFGPIPEMEIQKIGYGAGTRDLDSIPNILRVLIGGEKPILLPDNIMELEAAIDDMNPEFFGFAMERFFEHGALDVIMIPAFGKKNRPVTVLKILCPVEKKEDLIRTVLSETTSIGVRFREIRRHVLPRESVFLDTEFGKIAAKQITGPDGKVRISPEYECCREIAKKRNIPIKVVYDAVLKESIP